MNELLPTMRFIILSIFLLLLNSIQIKLWDTKLSIANQNARGQLQIPEYRRVLSSESFF
jgi:hypothetical protein